MNPGPAFYMEKFVASAPARGKIDPTWPTAKKLEELALGLPQGVEIIETYDRSALINRAVKSLAEKLVEEMLSMLRDAVFYLHRVFGNELQLIANGPPEGMNLSVSSAPGITKYKKLGKTGLEIADIVYGYPRGGGRSRGGWGGGRRVEISIEDTGCGIASEHLDKIFDPFFTTKDKERGTGLGLASAYGIIKNHGGIITVFSDPGHGTTISIYLPISEKTAHVEAHVEDMIIRGSGNILLIDDEDIIIDVGKPMLEKLGYSVIVAKGGKNAVDVVSKAGVNIDLVILDLIMPDMDGSMTFDAIREIHPKMPIVLSSGYSLKGKATDIMRRGCNAFIQKPFNISELSQMIRKVLDQVKWSD